MRCWYCKRRGHQLATCPQRTRERQHAINERHQRQLLIERRQQLRHYFAAPEVERRKLRREQKEINAQHHRELYMWRLSARLIAEHAAQSFDWTVGEYEVTGKEDDPDGIRGEDGKYIRESCAGCKRIFKIDPTYPLAHI